MKSFIIAQSNYCPIAWMYCQHRSNNLINRIHERALRIAYNDYVSDFSSMLDKDESITIHKRNIHALALEIYKTINNLNPKFMDEIFCVKQHNYSTRSQNLVYHVKYGALSHKKLKLPMILQPSKALISKYNRSICKCNLCKLYITNLGYINT